MKEYDAMKGSKTVFDFSKGGSFTFGDSMQLQNLMVYQRIMQNLSTTHIDDLTIQPGSQISTPGATKDQEAKVYGAFAAGNEKALFAGKMDLGDAAGGLFSTSDGLFATEAGKDQNYLLVLL